MMRIYNIYIMVVLMLSMGGCGKDIYNIYEGEDYVQFGPELKWKNDARMRMADTLKRATFYYKEPKVVRDTVYFDLYTVGQVTANDRTYKLAQEMIPGQENAVAGKHYLSFEDPAVSQMYKVRAGQSHTRVPVILLRDASLKQKEVVLKFKVTDNENFKQGMESNSWRKVLFTDRLSKPAAWDEWIEIYLGEYSLRKHEFMIEVTGKPWNQAFFEEMGSVMAIVEYWQNVLRREVADYNRLHEEPLRDPETDKLIIF